MGRGGIAGLAVLMALALTADGADAQRRGPGGRVGIALIGADPVGELAQYVDAGGGLQITGGIALEPSRHVWFRGDFGFLIYGWEQQRLCFQAPVGCRIQMDLNTTNSIIFGGVGPEVVLARGPVEPYLNAMMGFSYFATTSSLSGQHEYEDYFNTTNFSDAVMAWRVGGGMRVRVSRGRRPVSLDFGVERHENGLADFLTEGDIVDHEDGSITLYPNRAQANLVTFRVGVSIGM